MNQLTDVLQEKELSIIDLFLRLSENMVSLPHEDAFMEQALTDIGKAFKASRVYFFDYKNALWYNSFEWVRPGVPSVKHLFQGVAFEEIEQLSLTLETFSNKKIKIINHIDRLSQEEKDFFSKQGIVSMIAIPLFCLGECIGFFGIDQCEEVENWVEEYKEAAETMGHLLNNAKAHFRAQALLENEECIAKQMLDALPIPFYVVNPETHELILCNKVFENFVGAERLHFGKCYKILHNLDIPCDFCGIANIKEGKKPQIWQHRNDIFNADFNIISNEISWGDVENAYAVAFVDITDSLNIQREQVLQREAMKTKGRFLANMSHELRTPVNGIMGITRLAEKASTQPHVLAYLDKIQYSSKTLLTVINNILDFLKYEAGKMVIERCAFAAQEIFDRLEATFQREAEAKGLTLKFLYSGELPPILHGDPLRLEQIFFNLLSNAVKFCEQGYIFVEVQADISSKGTTCILQVKVSDTGPGMSEEHIEQLFNVFFRVDEFNTLQQSGAGIGLPLVQGLLTLMGGDIEVESVPGEGSIFTCIIPFGMGSVSEEMEAQMAVDAADMSVAGIRVLLAEDNEINALIATEFLESLQCTVDVATDGVHVLKLLETGHYDIILMDLEMPRMNGIQATAKIRNEARFDTLPILAMSAHTLQDMRNNKELSQMQDYITKPFDPQQVQALLYKYIRGEKKSFSLK